MTDKDAQGSESSTNIMDHIGHVKWESLHYTAFLYPENPTEEDKYWSLKFIQSEANLLPCPDCKQHWLRVLDELPLRNGSRKEFSEWSVDAHNKVNQRLGKPIVSYQEAENKFSPMYAQCASEDIKACNNEEDRVSVSTYWVILGLVLLGVLLAVISFLIGKNYQKGK